MTYKEYDNVYLDSSGTTCVFYNFILRNSNYEFGDGNTGGMESYTEPSPRDATGISGSPILITHNPYTNISDDYWHKMGAVIRSEEYVYCNKVIGVGNSFNIVEHKISDGSQTIVKVHDLVSTFRIIVEPRLSYISDRKILAYCGRAPTQTGKHEYVYIVDFENETATQVLDIDTTWVDYAGYHELDIYDVLTLKKSDGDVWFYITGWVYLSNEDNSQRSSGIFIYYKNYTQNGDWEVLYDTPPIPTVGSWDSEFASQSTVFVKDKYLVHIDPVVRWDGNPEDSGYVGYVFNLNTNVLTHSDIYPSADDWSVDICYKIAADYTNERVYFETYYYYDAGSSIEEFNPATLTFQCKFVNNDPDRDYYLYILSSRNRVYFYDYNDPLLGGRKLYTASDAQEVGSFDIDPYDLTYVWDYDVCLQMDDIGPSIWWFDRSVNIMKRISIVDGSVLSSYDLTGLITRQNKGAIWHLGNSLVYVTSNSWTFYFYLLK